MLLYICAVKTKERCICLRNIKLQKAFKGIIECVGLAKVATLSLFVITITKQSYKIILIYTNRHTVIHVYPSILTILNN